MTVFKLVMKLVLVFVVLGITLKGVIYYFQRDAYEFCELISDDFSVEKVNEFAEAKGYRSFDSTNVRGLEIVIPTQDSPYFRFACVLTFDDGILIRKEVRADD